MRLPGARAWRPFRHLARSGQIPKPREGMPKEFDPHSRGSAVQAAGSAIRWTRQPRDNPNGLSSIAGLLGDVATADPPTTITIRSSTRVLLESMKRPGETYDDLLQELAEEYYPKEIIEELRRRVDGLRSGRRRTIPAAEAYERLGV